jgi:hypothetical protein
LRLAAARGEPQPAVHRAALKSTIPRLGREFDATAARPTRERTFDTQLVGQCTVTVDSGPVGDNYSDPISVPYQTIV